MTFLNNEIFVSKNEKESFNFGIELAKKYCNPATIILLNGSLGAGNTVFAKGFAKGLGVKEQVSSPTYTVYRSYMLENKIYFNHIDAYRLESVYDLDDLGLNFAKSISLIEWGSIIFSGTGKSFLQSLSMPKCSTLLQITIDRSLCNENHRKFSIFSF